MADNCLSLEAWAYRQAFPESLWYTEAFSRENEALTKALQISLSDDSSGSPPLPASETRSASIFPEPAVLVSDTDSAPKRARNPVPCSSSGKITKRKSRASKRLPTTYITADPANFRQMVQQVTGIRFGDPTLPVEPVLKPEPQRAGVNRAVLQQSCLPTLDTSAFWLDRAGMVGSGSGDYGSVGPAVDEPGPLFDFETFSSFPTLESWGAM